MMFATRTPWKGRADASKILEDGRSRAEPYTVKISFLDLHTKI